jgi:flavin reductase (DIM6/NTAB) family NADH-FMN oxidoreductase RutF
MHIQSEPEILYFGTPVVLISSCNEDGSFNVAPISSVFWLGWRCVIGISAASKTTHNIIRNKSCTLNLPSVHEASAVNRLALTTGSNPVPYSKKLKGYRHVKDKFEIANLTKVCSELITAPRIRECPVQMEARLEAMHSLADDDENQKGKIVTMEFRILRIYLDENILAKNTFNRVDPDKWKPLIMSFQKFYGLSDQVHNSTLSAVPEIMYHSADLDKARKQSGPDSSF